MSDLTSSPVPALGPQDHARGDAHAPLVIVYADFTCPRCALADERLRGVAVRVAFRHFALRTKHPRAVALAQASEAAALQGSFWPMHDSLYADPGRLEDPHLWARVAELGIDLERFESDRRSQAVADRVADDVRGGLRAGVAVTPTLFADGRCHPGAPSTDLLARVAAAAVQVGWRGSEYEK